MDGTEEQTFIRSHYINVAGKYALLWQLIEYTVLGLDLCGGEVESGGVAVMAKCQDTPISGERSCNDIRAV